MSFPQVQRDARKHAIPALPWVSVTEVSVRIDFANSLHFIRPFLLVGIPCVCSVPQCRVAAQTQDSQGQSVNFDLDKDHLPIASLDGAWRFQSGDDPSWSDPQYDDSAWRIVRSDQTWKRSELVPGVSAVFWYRTRVAVPGNNAALAIYIPLPEVNYQVWADGQLIGSMGGLPPHPTPTRNTSAAYNLPAPSPGSESKVRVVTLALRCYLHPDAFYPPASIAPLPSGIRIGSAELIHQKSLLRTLNLFWYTAGDRLLVLLNSLAAFAAFALFLFRRKENEYLWYSLVATTAAFTHAYSIWSDSTILAWPLDLLISNALWEASSIALVLFVFRLLGGRRDRLFTIAVVSIFINFVVALVNFVPWMFSPDWRLFSISTWNGVSALLFLPSTLWVVVLIARRAIEGRSDARILLPAVVLAALGNLTAFILTSGRFLFGWSDASVDWFFNTSEWPIPFSVQNVADLLLLVTMLGVLILRFTRTRLQEEAYERERDAARTVQRVLVPEEFPATPGFLIQSVYHPYGEVGGDFFQIIPIERGLYAGCLLVCIGDVSGKGMPAAMTVSLLVGTFRSLAHFTQSPAEILAAMNQRMLARSNGGFTTCLVLRVDRSGNLTIANAGHISPYLGGKELSLGNGLPLGLSADTTYPESTSLLLPNEQLTLVTDGVVEARNKAGLLYGFERTAALSVRPAETIAQIAQEFGQDDDITVITLAMEQVPALL